MTYDFKTFYLMKNNLVKPDPATSISGQTNSNINSESVEIVQTLGQE